MSPFRVSIAGLLLTLRVGAAPSTAQKEWALAAAGILNEISGDRHDDVLGEQSAGEIANDERILIAYWGVRSRADLLSHIESLSLDGKTRFGAGWDYPRAIMLARWGYTVGYLTEDEAWSFIWPLAQRLQRTFSSWQDLGAAYLTARQILYASKAQDRSLAEYQYMMLVTTSTSPWRKYPWNLDLGNYPPVRPGNDKTASLTFAAHAGGLICTRLAIPDRVSRASFLPAIEQATGCRPRIDSERELGSDWVLDTECVQSGAARSAQLNATIRLQAIRSALEHEGVTQVFMYIEHPPASNAVLSPPAQNSWISGDQKINIYMRWLGDGLPDLTLTYGFSDSDVHAFLRAASVWALSALVLAWIMRCWLLQISASSRVQVLDAVWPVFRWSFWVAWLSVSVYFHGLEIAGFWSGAEGLGAELRAISWYAALACTLRTLTELIVSPALDSDKAGLQFNRLLAVCFLRSASEAPCVTVVLFVSNPNNPLQFSMLIFLSAIAAAAVFLAQHGLKLAMGQKGGIVRGGDLYDAVFALAKKMRVPLKRVYIQPEDGWKNLSPVAGMGGNLMIPERLLRSVSRREVDALVGRALLMLKTDYVQNALQSAVVIAALFLFRAYRAQMFQPGPFLLFGQIVLATEVLIGFLRYRRRRRKRIQAQLLALTSDAEGWAVAVAHTARLTGSALAPRVLERMAKIAGISLERLTMLAEAGLPESGSYLVPEFGRERLVVLK